MTLMLAGHETTANALTWTWYLLSTHPEAAAAVGTELDAVLGGRLPSYDDVAKLATTHATVAEAMRLYPPAWVMGRKILADVVADGWTLPRGSTAVACQWTLHRDKRSWPEPTAFRPTRWLDTQGRFDDEAPGQPRGAYIPFGLGNRVCIGESFAWTEAVLVLATLGRSWAPRLVPEQRIDVRAGVTLRPAYGMRMDLVPRAS
jgi:cytochrome P450